MSDETIFYRSRSREMFVESLIFIFLASYSCTFPPFSTGLTLGANYWAGGWRRGEGVRKTPPPVMQSAVEFLRASEMYFFKTFSVHGTSSVCNLVMSVGSFS